MLENTIDDNSSIDAIRVACIGESNTELDYYPRHLQTLLGTNYTVRNFGSGGATVLLNTDKPYIYQDKFNEAKKFLPDIAIIMLGTNDARTDYFKSSENFVSNYKELINQIQELENHPKIFLVKPPPIFDNRFELRNENLLDGIIPGIEEIANDEGLPIIDVYSVLENHPEHFWNDGVHLNSDGAAVIAKQVYKVINIAA